VGIDIDIVMKRAITYENVVRRLALEIAVNGMSIGLRWQGGCYPRLHSSNTQGIVSRHCNCLTEREIRITCAPKRWSVVIDYLLGWAQTKIAVDKSVRLR
jgi:hypothetical protein